MTPRTTLLSFLLPTALLSLMPMNSHAASNEGSADSFAWPDEAEAAVCMTFDDAIPSQLDNAIPELDEHHLLGTFFLTGQSSALRERMDEWVAAAKKGHELASHTAFHPCMGNGPGRDWVPAEFALEGYTLDRMAAELDVTDTLLHSLDGESTRTFAYPCGDTMVGDGESYVPLIEKRFVAARGVGPMQDDIRDLSFYNTGCFSTDGKTAEQCIAFLDEAAKAHQVAVFLFHGVGGDYLAMDNDEFIKLLDYLSAHRERFWVTTYKTAMQHAASEFDRLGWEKH